MIYAQIIHRCKGYCHSAGTSVIQRNAYGKLQTKQTEI